MADASTFAMLLRLLLSLAVVIGLMWAAATVLKKRGFAPAGNRRAAKSVQIEMLAKRGMGRNTSIAVVRVGDRSMVVGITDHQVTKLDDADIEDIDFEEDAIGTAPQVSAGTGSPWKMMLDQMRAKTVRR